MAEKICLNCGEVPSANLRLGKLSLTSTASNLQRLFANKYDSKPSHFEEESFYLKGFITKMLRGLVFLHLSV